MYEKFLESHPDKLTVYQTANTSAKFAFDHRKLLLIMCLIARLTAYRSRFSFITINSRF